MQDGIKPLFTQVQNQREFRRDTTKKSRHTSCLGRSDLTSLICPISWKNLTWNFTLHPVTYFFKFGIKWSLPLEEVVQRDGQLCKTNDIYCFISQQKHMERIFFVSLQTQSHQSAFVVMKVKKEVSFILAPNITAYLYFLKCYRY